MIDRDLAELYGVETKHLNRQVKRNNQRFPEEFMFQLTIEERNQPVTICHRFKTEEPKRRRIGFHREKEEKCLERKFNQKFL